MAVVGVLVCAGTLAGCGGAPAARPEPSPARATTTAAQPAGAPCSDPVVSARVDEALGSPTEGPHNGSLVTPDEARESGLGEDVVAQQAAVWAALTPEERAFQQCLRVRQGGDPGPDVEE
jgi:hypothetical protein